MRNFKKIFFYLFYPHILLVFFSFKNASAQQNADNKIFTREDSLRGSNGIGRTGWDVLHYDITIQPDFTSKTIKGKSSIYFIPLNKEKMQIDLQEPMDIDSIFIENKPCSFVREKNVFWVELPSSLHKKATMDIYFHGKPREAVNPPWDGGWVWEKDNNNNPWMSVACQGIGASVWYPCKDLQSDKADSGATLRIIVPDSLTGIGNGRLISAKSVRPGFKEYTWEVKSPINNYNIIPYIGKYKQFEDTFTGLNGKLDMHFWVLEYNLQKAKMHFADAKRTIKAFEYWMGPYPFYRDGYKLVEAPYLGMEHQSNIAYGNDYKLGYMGEDLSGTGWGLKWDFIIVHESGHEWFGNSITSKDIADMWIHEGFTNYSEVLFTDYWYGKKASDEYVIGLRKNIQNDLPIIGTYGVHEEGSGDMYYKGANLIHIIRQLLDNDVSFRNLLKGLNKQFYHTTVTTKQLEKFIIEKTGKNLSSLFEQYLRTTKIPILEYSIQKDCIRYRWQNTVSKFYLPIRVSVGTSKKMIWITPSEKWQSIKKNKKADCIKVDENFYVETKKI
jgi:aminopeptidase N